MRASVTLLRHPFRAEVTRINNVNKIGFLTIDGRIMIVAHGKLATNERLYNESKRKGKLINN